MNAGSILLLSHNLELHQGAPRFLYYLARGLKGRGYDPVVAAPVAGDLEHWYRADGIPVHLMDDNFSPAGFDLVIVNTLVLFHLNRRIREAGVPVIGCVHEQFSGAISRDDIAVADAVVLVCWHTRDCFDRAGYQGRFHVIRNGFALDRLDAYRRAANREQVRAGLDLAPDDLVIVSVGGINPHKGQGVLAEALTRLDRPRLRCFIVGPQDPGYVEQIHETLRGSDMERRFHIVAGTDVHPYLLAADLFCLLSRFESCSVAILEAMAFGLPVVATTAGGTPEQVRHGETGILVHPGDAQAAARAIENLADDPGRRSRFGRRAREVVELHFGMERCLNQFEALIRAATRPAR